MATGKGPFMEKVDEFTVRQRRESLLTTMGSEGNLIAPLSHQGRTMAVFTSGGDSQGKRVSVYACLSVLLAAQMMICFCRI
jgi:hypothetical protein